MALFVLMTARRGPFGLAFRAGSHAKVECKCDTPFRCPILDPCRDAGQFEPWGVWAGIDRSPTKRKPDNRQETQ